MKSEGSFEDRRVDFDLHGRYLCTLVLVQLSFLSSSISSLLLFRVFWDIRLDHQNGGFFNMDPASAAGLAVGVASLAFDVFDKAIEGKSNMFLPDLSSLCFSLPRRK